jgi:hypothetical protein
MFYRTGSQNSYVAAIFPNGCIENTHTYWQIIRNTEEVAQNPGTGV